MSMKQIVISPEINMDDILAAMVENLTIDELVEFVEELLDSVADQDFNHELYELMRRKHGEVLDEMGISESEYQSDYAPTDYDEDEDDEDDDDEAWTTDPDNDLGEENPMDVFTTETEH